MNFLQMLLSQRKQKGQPIRNTRGKSLNILLSNRHPEDSSFRPGQQLPYQQNSDVANFPIHRPGTYEDQDLVDGPQGLAPYNAGVAHLQGPMQPMGRQYGIPLQGGQRSAQALEPNPLRYRQMPQATQPWFDF